MKLFFGHPVLVLPGLNGSGPQHWQTLWESNDAAFRRVHAQDWDNPQKAHWVANLESAVKEAGPGAVLVAHSLACLQVVHWAEGTSLKIAGAFLVAPPNPDRPDFPSVAHSFRGVSRKKLLCKSILIASTDDPYGDIHYTQQCADDWGCRFVSIGAKGHINAASQLGEWPEGMNLLTEFVNSLT